MAMASSSFSSSSFSSSRYRSALEDLPSNRLDHALPHRSSLKSPLHESTMSLASPIADSFFLSIDKIVQSTARIRRLDPVGHSMWLHGEMCREIVSSFVLLQQHLRDPSIRAAFHDASEQNHGSLKAAMENLLRAMRESEKFVEWCKCTKQMRHGLDHELVWMRKAFSRGLSVEPTETYLHDFMSAVCVLRDALRIRSFSFVPDAARASTSSSPNRCPSNGAATLDPSFRRLCTIQKMPPEVFWEDDDARDLAYVLIDAARLDNARNADIDQMKEDLNNILRNPASEGDDFKADLGKLLQEKIEDYRRQAKGLVEPAGESASSAMNSNSPESVDAADRSGYGGGEGSMLFKYPDLTSSFYGDFRDIEKLQHIYPPRRHAAAGLSGDDKAIVEVHKVSWRPAGPDAVFALKLYWGSGAHVIFQIEAPIHLRLHHPNIVQSFCVFKDGESKSALLMELMEMNLTQFLSSHAQNLSLATQISIMLQIAKGMEYLHSLGFIHRDLKPENVLINEDAMATAIAANNSRNQASASASSSSSRPEFPIVKVADFNTARRMKVEQDPPVTKRIGTSIYRAPEVLNEDDSSSYGASVDVYSFAMVSFKILSGTEAFAGYQAKEKSKMILEGQRPDVTQELRGYPAYLQRCLEAWWDPNAEKRPSFKEICRVLRHLHGVLVREEGMKKFLDVKATVSKEVWKSVQEKARQEMEKLEVLRKEGRWRHSCKHSAVNEIPYEMYTMSFVEMALELYLWRLPEQETKLKQKSGVMAYLSSCFGFCMSEMPKPRPGDAIA